MFTACPVAVALAGATIVTCVMLVTLVTLVTLFTTVVLLLFTLLVIRIPTLTTAGALVTTAGAVPTGAGMMIPSREPGGGGTNTPSGPMQRGPATTPGRGRSTSK